MHLECRRATPVGRETAGDVGAVASTGLTALSFNCVTTTSATSQQFVVNAGTTACVSAALSESSFEALRLRIARASGGQKSVTLDERFRGCGGFYVSALKNKSRSKRPPV